MSEVMDPAEELAWRILELMDTPANRNDYEFVQAIAGLVRARIEALEAALREIAALDPKDSETQDNEWAEAEFFGKAQDIARAALSPTPER